MKLAENIVDVLLRNIDPNTEGAELLRRAKARADQKREEVVGRRPQASHAPKPRPAWTKLSVRKSSPPAKAIYFSGAGYSGQGMHAVGGGGGEYGGGLAVG